jgi:hypothetical protein
LPLLLSAGAIAIANVAATNTAAPVPSAVIAATAAYFSAAVTTVYVSTFPTASMFHTVNVNLYLGSTLKSLR